MSLDAALGTLARALSYAGVAHWSAPADHSVLADLENEISPLRLPADLREFWCRVDPATMPVQPGCRFDTLDFVLLCHRMARDEFPRASRWR